MLNNRSRFVVGGSVDDTKRDWTETFTMQTPKYQPLSAQLLWSFIYFHGLFKNHWIQIELKIQVFEK